MTAAQQQDLAELLSICGAPASGGDQAGPVFDQPWHAEAVATTVTLSRNGIFSWEEWIDCFSGFIANAPQKPGENVNTAYYRQWLSALEAILTQKKVIEQPRIAETKEDWRRSYLNTAHGKPVVFQRGLPEPDHHDHDDDRHHHHGGGRVAPISVSPARAR